MDSGLQAFEKGHLAFQKIKFNQGKKRFKKLLMEISQDSFEVQSDKVLEAFDDYKGDYERLDDVTVVGFGF